MASKKEAFVDPDEMFDAIAKTFVMFVGEVGYGDLKFGNEMAGEENNCNTTTTTTATTTTTTSLKDLEDLKYALEWEINLGKIMTAAFIFLFVIVLMNLLNAIAIGDIQVHSLLNVTDIQ